MFFLSILLWSVVCVPETYMGVVPKKLLIRLHSHRKCVLVVPSVHKQLMIILSGTFYFPMYSHYSGYLLRMMISG